MLRAPIALLAACLLVPAGLAGPADAAHKASKSQTRAIARAVQGTSLGGANRVPHRWYRVDRVKISSLSPSWAMAGQRATRAGRNRFQPAIFVLVQPQGSKRWVVVSLGTALVGCGVAPNKVLADLMGTKGTPCPPGEGIKGT